MERTTSPFSITISIPTPPLSTNQHPFYIDRLRRCAGVGLTAFRYTFEATKSLEDWHSQSRVYSTRINLPIIRKRRRVDLSAVSSVAQMWRHGQIEKRRISTNVDRSPF